MSLARRLPEPCRTRFHPFRPFSAVVLMSETLCQLAGVNSRCGLLAPAHQTGQLADFPLNNFRMLTR